MKHPFTILFLPSALALILIGACWASTLFVPAASLMMTVLLVSFVVFVGLQKWIAAALLLVLNPLAVFFIGGVAAYVGGEPSLRFAGHGWIESYSLDRSTRCFWSGGGYFVRDNEWVFILPHNSALHLMSSVFGTPSQSYDGPYPSRDEALALLTGATTVPLSNLLSDRVGSGRDVWPLEEGVGETLVSGLGFFPLDETDTSDEDRIKVTAAFHKERCLVLRIYQKSLGVSSNDYLVLLDKAKGKPFAYFCLVEEDVIGFAKKRFPPVRYDDPKHIHALQRAAEKGNIESLKRLVGRSVAVDLQTPTGTTALMTAVRRGHADAASFLLAQGADVNKADNNNYTPLFHLDADDGTICALLLKHGVDITVRDHGNKTPLLHAVAYGNAGVVEKLLSAGADPDDRDCDGKNAMDLAQERKGPRIIEILEKRVKGK